MCRRAKDGVDIYIDCAIQKLKSTAKWPDASPHPSVDSSLAGNTDLDASQTSDNAKGSFLNKLFSTKPVVRPPPPKPRRRP